jgi:aldehyde dehydrogenase (NAD+)
LISALAAGNTAMLKPSEMTPATSRVIQEIVEDAFDESEVAVFQGAAETSQALLALKFDHCFFTGSPQVGKIVMSACAQNLTSVTLELGGKSPAVIDSTVNMKDAAGSLAFGKCSNAGQICIAPDYLLIEEAAQAEFLQAFDAVLKTRYGNTAAAQKSSPDYTRIINVNHVKRIQGLIDDAVEKGAEVAIGGEVDVDDRYIQPTVLINVPRNARILEEEIFGPVLPLVTWQDQQEAIDYINAGEKPLALYVYSKNEARIKKVLASTSSGDAAINTCLVQFLNHNVPFGGANNSGIGNSHGIHGFKAFSHERGVVRDRFALTQLFSAPYTPFVKRFVKFAVRWMT